MQKVETKNLVSMGMEMGMGMVVGCTNSIGYDMAFELFKIVSNFDENGDIVGIVNLSVGDLL